MRRIVVAILCLAAAAAAQNRFDNGLNVTFRHGALHVHTESTMVNSAHKPKGVVAIDEGGISHRLVTDSHGRVMFAYDLALMPAEPGFYTVRALPRDPEHFVEQYVSFAPGDRLALKVEGAAELDGPQTVQADGNIRLPMGEVAAANCSPGMLAARIRRLLSTRMSDPQVRITVLSARRDYATIAAMREFPRIAVGETVRLEVLSDAATGERLFDVIQPVLPVPRRQPAPEEEISLEEIRLSINGERVTELRNTWMIGSAVKIALPRIGTVFLLRTPPDAYGFEKLGDVNGKLLTFSAGEDRVEILSKSNILKTSETGAVWVYRDLKAPRTASVAVDVGFAEDLLPKR